MTENQPLPDGTDLNDLMAGEWKAPAEPVEADEPDDEPKEMEDLHSLGVTQEQMDTWFRRS